MLGYVAGRSPKVLTEGQGLHKPGVPRFGIGSSVQPQNRLQVHQARLEHLFRFLTGLMAIFYIYMAIELTQLSDVHSHGLDQKHFQGYLDEFCYRFY